MTRSKPSAGSAWCAFPTCRSCSITFAKTASNITWRSTSPKLPTPQQRRWANTWVGTCIPMPDSSLQSAALAGPEARLHLGAAYYPEHWPEERWPEDIRLMQEAGLTVVRLGEFAWSTFEPAGGDYQFEWMERAVQMLADAGLQVVMGTPTAAPPAWLVH